MFSSRFRFFTKDRTNWFNHPSPVINTCHPNMVFDTTADLPACPKVNIAFVKTGENSLAQYIYQEGAWTPYGTIAGEPVDTGGGDTENRPNVVVTNPTQLIPAIANQRTYTVTANGGNLTASSVKGILLFRNGNFVEPNHYGITGSTFTINANEPNVRAGEHFTIIILNVA